MAPGPEADGLYLARILELIELINASLAALGEADFIASRDTIGLAAFRLAQIGELTNKLSKDVQQRHPEIAWKLIYGFRDIVAHNYDRAEPAIIWRIATNSLSALATICRDELARLDS